MSLANNGKHLVSPKNFDSVAVVEAAKLERKGVSWTPKSEFSRLKRTLKPKIWQAIHWAISEHRCQDLKIVGIDEVAGSKERAKDWYGESVAVRYVYDDTSTDYWGDSYGGLIWIPIGKARYLQIHIWG